MHAGKGLQVRADNQRIDVTPHEFIRSCKELKLSARVYQRELRRSLEDSLYHNFVFFSFQ